jgi:2-hydroxychromene-2-carboxylate isomerase
MRNLEFYFDYRSPYSYLAHSQLERLDAEVTLLPFDLIHLMNQVENVPTSVVCKPKNRYVREDLVRWAKRYGVPFQRHPQAREIDGRRLLRATLAAGQVGKMAAAAAAIFKAYWGGPQPLQSVGEVVAVLAGTGVDASAVEPLIDAPDTDRALDAATAAAVARGVFGSPTFLVGEQMFFGNDRLDFVRDSLGKAA